MRCRLPTVIALLLCACTGSTKDDPAMSGYAEAELVYVAPAAAGTLRALAVQRGDSVKRGQRLYALDSDAELLEKQAAQARSEQAQAQEQDLRKGKRPAELQAIDQQLVQARATLAASTSTLQRNQLLVNQGFQSPLRLEELVAARDRDAAHVRELQAQRALATQAARSDEIAAAAAGSRSASSDVALTAWREAQKTREAPADALVFDVMYRVGEWVNAGAPVVALLPPGALKLRFFVPEAALPRAAVGAEVALACDGCGSGLRARIRWVSPQAEYTPPVIYSNASRSKLVFAVEATPLEGAASLKPGQPIDVRFAPAKAP
ncbi:MAG: HlyD family efflux transporter periplasmic adaptor subunit [Pseudomonadota bacterium]